MIVGLLVRTGWKWLCSSKNNYWQGVIVTTVVYVCVWEGSADTVVWYRDDLWLLAVEMCLTTSIKSRSRREKLALLRVKLKNIPTPLIITLYQIFVLRIKTEIDNLWFYEEWRAVTFSQRTKAMIFDFSESRRHRERQSQASCSSLLPS